MDNYITLQTAKAAKAAGITSVLHTHNVYALYNSSGQPITSKSYFEKERDLCYMRYTQEELTRLLREDHSIMVVVSPWRDEEHPEGSQISYETAVIDVNDDWNTFSTHSFYSNYYDALEHGLLIALEYVSQPSKV